MRISIRHTTTYRYETPVTRLAQVIRKCPVSTSCQQVIQWQVRGSDGRALPSVRDGFGNIVHYHSVTGAVQEISTTVEGSVETQNCGGITASTFEPLPPVFYLAATDYTRSDDAIAALAHAARKANEIDSLHTLMGLVGERIAYLVDTTDVTHTAAEALALGSGVCQDQAHVMISAARLLGLPARYVSGYLWSPERTEDVASHAWMEALVGDLGWTGFDAANQICPSDSYVRLAIGRDYADAAPVRGMRIGGTQETMQVRVQVQTAGQQ